MEVFIYIWLSFSLFNLGLMLLDGYLMWSRGKSIMLVDVFTALVTVISGAIGTLFVLLILLETYKYTIIIQGKRNND